MADKANPCTEGTLVVGTWDEGDVSARAFLACFLCSAAAVLFASHILESLCMEERHMARSMTVCSQESGVMAKAFRDVFRVSLKRFFWPPWDRFPCCSSP